MDPYRLRLSAVVLAVGLGAAGSAGARNDKLLLPIDPVMRSQVTQNLLASDIPMKFGRASAKGVDISNVASVEARSGTRTSVAQGVKSDEDVCTDAFRQAVASLQTRARQAGAVAVVGIVSNYGGIEMDSPTAYECHIGLWRAEVHLKGQFVRGPVPARPAANSSSLPSVPAATRQG